MTVVKAMVEKEKPAKTITVGDRVSQDLTDHQLAPDILIVDDKIMRKEIPPITAAADSIIKVHNPPGTITAEARQAVVTAMRSLQRTRITVDGEEDLLALIAIAEAPQGSLVFYGQPREGIVAIKATEETQQKVRRIIERMQKA